MIRIIIAFLIFFTCFDTLKSDTIYWASKVVGFSSQLSNKEYSSNQILGLPRITPEQGLSAVAWSPKYPTDRIEWIRLKFDKKIFVKQILINENLNPGAIVKVILYDSLNQGKLVYSNNIVNSKSQVGKLSKIDVENVDFSSNELKIEVNIIDYLDQYQIEAVGIADYISDYQVKINYFDDSLKYNIERLGESINSKFRELSPIISQDGKSLVFTREGHPENIGKDKKQDVWISRIDSLGNFSVATNLGEPINNENANFAISITTDANTIFLGNIYLPDGKLKSGFSYSTFDGNNWQYPDSISIANYYNLYRTGSFNIANNGKILITAVKRDDSFGKTDLYVSFLDENGKWTEPKNLGLQINSAEEEISPYLASDNKTLYFATKGLPGFGNQDMFYTKRLDDSWTNWTEPVNLGPLINTSGWDAYYSITANGEYAYFVSSQNHESAEDIYRIKLPQVIKPEIVTLVKGLVLNQKTKLPISASIHYEILPEGIEAGIAKSNPKTGEYSIILPAGKKYGFSAKVNSFVSINENLDLVNIDSYSEITRNLYLVPIEKGQTVRINNIFFEYNESELLPESYSELNRIVKLLNDNPALKIQINGHTDNVGNNSSNKNLSLKRAESVYNYLIQNKIDNNRLKIVGYGSTKPIASNLTEIGRSENRRVEFLILEN
jgi:outer membrane protein OmpA-like peptidoglycan-associated protein